MEFLMGPQTKAIAS